MKVENYNNSFPEIKKKKFINKTTINDYITGFLIGLSLTFLAFPFSKFLKKNKKRDKAILFGCIFSIFFIFINSVVFLSYRSYRKNLRNKNLGLKNKKIHFLSTNEFVEKSVSGVFPSFNFFNFWFWKKNDVKKKNLKRRVKKKIL